MAYDPKRGRREPRYIETVPEEHIPQLNKPDFHVGDTVDVEIRGGRELQDVLRVMTGKVEGRSVIRSQEDVWNIYIYFIDEKPYCETALKKHVAKMDELAGITESQKLYVWRLVNSLPDGHAFEIKNSKVSPEVFTACVKRIQDGRHLWPKDISFNEAYSKVRVMW